MRQRRTHKYTNIKQYLIAKRALTPTISKRDFAPAFPDILKYFYAHKPYRPRFSITLDDIAGILALTQMEARNVMQEINAMPRKSKFPFITVKDMAIYMKVAQWQIQQYFVSFQQYEHYEMRERYKRKK